MGTPLSELFVEISAPLKRLGDDLKDAQATIEAAAEEMGASASVNLGGAISGGMETSLSGMTGAIGTGFAMALVPLQGQIANLGQILSRAATQSNSSLSRLESRFKSLLHVMDEILGMHFDKELEKQIAASKNVVWTKWLEGVQVMRRLQTQSEFTRASFTRLAGAIKSLNPLGGLFKQKASPFKIPDVEGVRSSSFKDMLKNPLAKAPPGGGSGGGVGGGMGMTQYSMLPAVAATAGVAAGMTKAVNLASDFAETASKVGVVFGDSASVVTKSADEMATKFGVPKKEMMDSAAILGLMAKGAGQSEDAAAKFGVSLSKLALDASSFYNTGLDVALEKIRAGLSGEAEPLRTFGVFLTENAVKAEAARMGLAAFGAELTEGQKIMARSSLIFKGLSDAQGDLERTQGGYANQVREMEGRLSNLATMIGEQLLPTFTELISATNETLQSFELSFDGMKSAIKSVVDFFRGTVETIGVIYRNWGAIVERTGVMIAGMWTNLGETIAWLGDSIAAFLDFFSTNWTNAFMVAFDAVTTALVNLGQNIRDFGASVYDWIASGFQNPFEIKLTPVMEGFNSSAYGFKMPELKLSSFADQFAGIDERMAAAEQQFQDNRAGQAQDLKKKTAAIDEMPQKEGKASKGKKGRAEEVKAEFLGIADFAKRIQQGALDREKKEQLEETKKGNSILGDIRDSLNRPQLAVAGGKKN